MELSCWALVRVGAIALAVSSLLGSCGVPEIQNTKPSPDAGPAGAGGTGGTEYGSGGLTGGGAAAGGIDAGPPPDGTCADATDCASFPSTKLCDTRFREAGGAAGAWSAAGSAGVAESAAGASAEAGTAGSGPAGAAGRSEGKTDSGVLGRCVECLTTTDCGTGRYCTETNSCAIGCEDDSGCAAGQLCDPATHLCTHCASAPQDCPAYTVCDTGDAGAADSGAAADGVCVPTCTAVADCPSGWLCCGAQCKNVAADLGHCGACDQSCSIPNAVARCANSQCELKECESGWGDCIADTEDPASIGQDPKGCETNLMTDSARCGNCEISCNYPKICLHGLCSNPECDAGFKDCQRNGSCQNLQADPLNCGECGETCAPVHGVPSCALGQCLITCDADYANCDGDAKTNGCEVNLRAEVEHCGQCSFVCKNEHGGTRCSAGVCAPYCSVDYADCDNFPENGCETNIYQTVTSCGACSKACAPQNATATCAQGLCGYTACSGTFADCDGNQANGCESDPNSDALNCGGCGKACSGNNGTPLCKQGGCTISCNTGYADCDQRVDNGCETPIGQSALNCGACGKVCPTDNGTPNCVNGYCGTAQCKAGFGDCNGSATDLCETDLTSNVLHCGVCGQPCSLPHATPKCVNSACVVGACDAATATTPAYGDCDPARAGCESPLNTVTDCGACGVACSPPHAQGTCATGTCGIRVGGCEAGYQDCNGNPDDGCETNVATSVNQCGSCQTVCSSAGGIPSCRGSVCQIDCDAAHGNCDGNIGNGCETNLTNDVNNCGGCNNACPNVHGTPGCSGGACTIGCSNGFADCNQTAADGCEVSLNTDSLNCGACKKICSLPNALAQCTNGGCTIAACNPGYLDCNNNPVDGCEINGNTDILHCGSCPNACSVAHGAPACSSGVCVVGGCNTGWDDCDAQYGDGCEVNLLTSATNCSHCGSPCGAVSNGTPGCAAGACTVASCNTGFANCDGQYANGCEINIGSSAANCGSCGTICSAPRATSTCSGGGCRITAGACDLGYADCDGIYGNGCEINTDSDPNHCGSCTTVCPAGGGGTPICVSRVCGNSAAPCTDPLADCNGLSSDSCEANLSSSVTNCGSCGHACSFANASAGCSNKSCVMSCSTGWSDCDSDTTNGCETNTNTNVARCGSCTNACTVANGTPSCTSGSCGVSGCNTGYGNCDGLYANGCEANFSNNVAHCGNCATACAVANGTPSCASGSCGIASCSTGYGNCDGQYSNGCEASFASDANHCGNCTTACTVANGTPRCASGACGILSCNTGYYNCDNLYSTGCEANLTNSVANCGACNNACSNAHGTTTCTNGACVPTCQSGYASCNGDPDDGCEAQLGTTTNCAACGNSCAYDHGVAACVSGACTLSSCATGYGNCDGNATNGCEANLTNSVSSCGSCGNSCANAHGNTTCTNGTCVPSCNAGWADCDGNPNNGCETDLTSSATSCGSCGNDCTTRFANATGTCSASACVIGACAGGFSNCDGSATNGCETNTQTDAGNCGGCGTVCNTTQNVSGAACIASGCVLTCAAGYGNCDGVGTGTNGCEVNLTNSFSHCGACTTACSAGQTCISSTCTNHPCTGLCSNPTVFTDKNYQSGGLGIAATCHETTTAIGSVVCGNFVSPRRLSVNGTAWGCDVPGQAVPAARYGGYCVQTTAGDYSWAYFATY